MALLLVAACVTEHKASPVPEAIGTGSPTSLPSFPTPGFAHTATPSPTPIPSLSPTPEPTAVPSPTVAAAKPTRSPVSYESKIGSGLRFLLSVQGTPNAPLDLEDILGQDSIAVNITFTHELQAEELSAIESFGVTFSTVNHEIAHVGEIYGAWIPWDTVGPLAELGQVVTIESQWSPWDIPPPP